jgi:hypothetical protein
MRRRNQLKTTRNHVETTRNTETMIQPLVKRQQEHHLAMIKSHPRHLNSASNILQPNNILGMIPIPYP